jgi:hypothetical protein
MFESSDGGCCKLLIVLNKPDIPQYAVIVGLRLSLTFRAGVAERDVG